MGAMYGGDDDDYGDEGCYESYSEPKSSFQSSVKAPSYASFQAPQVLAMAKGPTHSSTQALPVDKTDAYNKIISSQNFSGFWSSSVLDLLE